MISKGIKDPNILDKIRVKGIAKAWRNFKYFFRRKRQQFKRLRKYVPMIWNGYDFDYRYALELFSAKLEDIAERMESDNAMSVESPHCATRIRTAIRLMKKVYDEEYACEYQDKMEAIYGKELLEYKFVDTGKGDGSSFLKQNYELTETPERIAEIDEIQSRLIKESRLKQEKAHRILWEFIEHNIKHWWD
jgi:hypothetical protein